MYLQYIVIYLLPISQQITYNNCIDTVYYTYIISYTVYPTVSVYLTSGEYTYTKRLEP